MVNTVPTSHPYCASTGTRGIRREFWPCPVTSVDKQLSRYALQLGRDQNNEVPTFDFDGAAPSAVCKAAVRQTPSLRYHILLLDDSDPRTSSFSLVLAVNGPSVVLAVRPDRETGLSPLWGLWSSEYNE